MMLLYIHSTIFDGSGDAFDGSSFDGSGDASYF